MLCGIVSQNVILYVHIFNYLPSKVLGCRSHAAILMHLGSQKLVKYYPVIIL